MEGAYTFEGYVRPNGQVGTRNFVAVISNVNCSASVASMIARHFTADTLKAYGNVDGVIAFRHESGCGMAWEGARHRTLNRVLAGIARHPNIGACLLVGLGCEQGTLDHLVTSQHLHQIHLAQENRTGPATAFSLSGGSAAAAEPSGGRIPIPVLSIQQSGGTQETAERGVQMVASLLPQVNSALRSTVPASKLVLATECGGSDGYSGITANPVLGAAADLLIACGGTVVLSETPEIFGAEHLLTCRARSPHVAEKLLDKIRWWQQYCSYYGEQLDHNPSVGNKAGGLTTIVEKSLGAVAKAGSMRLEDVVDYAEPVVNKGLVFMDSPGFDPASVTGMIAGGANLVAFTTGRGSCFGSKPAPTYKIASNSELFRRLPNDMDFDAGCVLSGQSVQEAGPVLLQELLEAASGKRTCSERLGIGDEEFVPWLVGPML
jgi:altronate hydrolase